MNALLEVGVVEQAELRVVDQLVLLGLLERLDRKTQHCSCVWFIGSLNRSATRVWICSTVCATLSSNSRGEVS